MQRFNTGNCDEWRPLDMWPVNVESDQLQVATFSVEQEGRVRAHKHLSEDILWYVVEGRGHVEVDGERIEVRSGDAVLIEAPAFHGAWADLGERLKILQIECILAGNRPPDSETALIRLVRFALGDDRRPAFDTAQRGWGALADIPGAVAQVGGWTSGGAVALSAWRSAASHAAFVSGAHAELVRDLHGGGHTHDGTEIATFARIFEQAGRAGGFGAALRASGPAHLALQHVRFRVGRSQAFLRAVQERWLAAMCCTGELSAAIVGRNTAEQRELLVASLWASEAAAARFFAASELARELEDTRAVVSETVQRLDLEAAWQVAGPPG